MLHKNSEKQWFRPNGVQREVRLYECIAFKSYPFP